MATLKHRLIIFLLAFLILIAGAFITLSRSALKRGKYIVIGAKNGSENLLLSEIIFQLLKDRTDLEIIRHFHLDGTFICFNALKTKEIDLYVEYTGTALSTILKEEFLSIPSKEILPKLRKTFHKQFGLKWLSPLGFSSAYVIIAQADFAKKRGIETLSDLATLLKDDPNIRIGFDPEFYARAERSILEKEYGMCFSGLKLLDHSLLYLALLNRSIDVINAHGVDGLIKAHGFQVFTDDAKHFPSYDAVPLVREDTLKAHPEIQLILEGLEGQISFEEIQTMNYEVEKKGESIYNVAQKFLIQKGLLSL